MIPWLVRIVWIVVLVLPHTATAAEHSLTILVRDTDSNRLPGVYVEIVQLQPPAAPKLVVQRRTDADGRVADIELDAAREYLVSFHGVAPVMFDGEQAATKLIQTTADQNTRGGFPVGMEAGTLRFVIGGTFSEGMVAAVPMVDLAETDDAPIRPINPLTGDELTPAQARTFHAAIGEPWEGVPPAAEVVLAPRAFPNASNERKLAGIMLIVALALVVQALLWHRRRSA